MVTAYLYGKTVAACNLFFAICFFDELLMLSVTLQLYLVSAW